MTLTLSPEIEWALTEEALKDKYGTSQETPEERRARIQAIKGSMAYLGPSRILEDRAEDQVREERRWQK